MKVIIVTGSVASGKTTLSQKLAKKLSFRYVDINKFTGKGKIYSGYDNKRKCKIVDIKELNKSLIELINNYKKQIGVKSMISKTINKPSNKKKKIIKEVGIIIDSHLSHYIPRKFVDLCIVTKCSLKELHKRLKKRGYDKNKIMENIECEIFDICLHEAKEAKHKVYVIDTTKGINISEISKKIKL